MHRIPRAAVVAASGSVFFFQSCSRGNFYFPQAGRCESCERRAARTLSQSQRAAQELDDEFLVVWHGFNEMHGKRGARQKSAALAASLVCLLFLRPWDYKDESSLRAFLLERIKEGYSFPLNPARDPRAKKPRSAFPEVPKLPKGVACAGQGLVRGLPGELCALRCRDF